MEVLPLCRASCLEGGRPFRVGALREMEVLHPILLHGVGLEVLHYQNLGLSWVSQSRLGLVP